MMPIAEREADTERGRLAWIEKGSGWPVILVHAFPLHGAMWRRQMERCSTACRLIAPDLRGFGATPLGPGPDDGRVPCLDDYAADVFALMDALELEDATIGGLSLGGYVAFAMYRRDRTRFTALILADTKPGADTPAAAEARQALRTQLTTAGQAALADAMIPHLLSDTARAERPELGTEIRTMAAANALHGLDRALIAMLGRPDSTSMLPHITCPTLVVVGAEDAVTPPSEAEAMERAIPRSTLAVIPGAGHLSSLEQPDVFSRALDDFLRARL